ncbi:hypothetical protein [Acetatifactor aquisgranensis]|uniref:hypothetical protein n=1 Tax=Acetatifactor aquisgranensis TaxID=2941233 RepID=UPI00203FAEB4|nr:hypothetical protein [Acetatifactor aquisgranensis]MCI8541792.1 hypothetical protein [Lachnospiraceae bacterium]
MSSRIEQLIDELEEYIESCKPKFMSNSEIIVNKDEIDELLRELRMRTPEEIKRYQKIISNKDAILNDARSKAQALIDEATVHTNELISEHEIMQQAYSQANGIVATAARQAQEILDKATMEANELRMQASLYTEDRLTELDSIISAAIQSTNSDYERLAGSLGQYRDLIQSNLRALHPAENLDIHLDDPEDDDKLDVL